MSDSFIVEWARAQQPKAPNMKNASVFYRNLEEELDVRRSQHGCIMLHTKEQTSMVDFSSTDILGLSTSGSVRKGYLDELAKHPDFKLSSHGSRLTDGNSRYLEGIERELAAFHGAESGLIVNTGSLGNAAIFSVIPRPGDAIVYDELIHASMHDGMKDSLALYRKTFRHNNAKSLYNVLVAVQESQPQIRNSIQSVLVAVESVYSMDRDICPLQKLIKTAKEVFLEGNIQFIINKTHSTGIIRPNGTGLVYALGLESKTLAATGAVILYNNTVRMMLINYARSIIFSVAPFFPMLASIRATYQLLRSGEAQEAQNRVQEIVKFFLETIISDPIWSKASNTGLLRLPMYEDADIQSVLIQIIQLRTRTKHNFYLAFHLQRAGFLVFPISYPVVPKGTEHVRIIFHASNMDTEVKVLVTAIAEWAQEILEIKSSGDRQRVPAAARHVYALIAQANLNGSE
ncbi:aminotransferase class I/II-fold pyridoxal phosphate-dependent enzyme [Aspergillus neoniger CBS 115656]|uniref:Class II aminotransferase/8-amino-7-oxononanoate synthase n=1 Tax=Aspergillus neoniger (strain CBS 115656) TaxID=1448310 RepID=A0A318YHH0_ASPNB|nr:class II aminotransferase/8-amino-7-oxononanoate synthase [Aspergillus neoniger CBS 115656]PYH32030.1 class II aminotransferase/8-amino-7-oxononanoate synthase [Aspergillus neoniger CBS 115656]